MSRENLPFIKGVGGALLLALFGTSSAMAAVPVTGDKVGSLITVKTGASLPSVASDPAGDSVVVWNTAQSIIVQRYDADGKPVGGRFQANTSTGRPSEGAKVAMDAAGDFVVAWTADVGAITNVFAQLFDKNGNKVGTEFQVNQGTGIAFPNSNEFFPLSVAMDAAGNFVVVWTGTDAGDGVTPDSGIFAQRFDNTGTALTGSDIAVNVTTTGRQVSPTIAMSPNGAYVIAWTGVDAGDGTTSDQGILAQLYDATGAVIKPEFVANTQTLHPELLPAAGMDLTGNFVIAWSTVEFGDQFGLKDIHAQRFDATGTTVGGEFLVNAAALGNQLDGTVGVQSDATVAMDVNGNFVIGWDSQFDDTGVLGDYVNFYKADGTLQGGTKLEGLADTGFAPAVAMDASGDTFASATITTNSVSGLFAQRFAGFNALNLGTSLASSAPAVVKPGDAISLTTSITNFATAGTPTGIPAIDAALSTSTSVQEAFTLPAGTTVSSSSGTGWTCPASATANVLTCSFAGGLTAGTSSSVLTVNLQASDTGGVNSFTNDASGLQPDPDTSNNEGSVGVAVDHPPVAIDGSLAVPLNTATGGSAIATDVDGDTLTFSAVTSTANGTLTFNPDGSFSYTPNTGFSGHDTFTFKANDGNFDSNVGTFTLRVDNQAPAATDGALTIDEDTVGTGSVAATDAEGDALTFSEVSGPANGTLTVNANGSFQYTPNANFNGTDSFTFKANDGLADSNTGTVTITINPVNDAPVANDSTLTTAEDTLGTGTVTATDVDGDILTFSKASSPAHGSATVNTDGSFSYTPAADFNGSDSFTFSVSDGNGGSATGTVSVTVTAVNDAPVAADKAIGVLEDSSNNADLVVATDVDGDTLTYSLVSDVTHGTLSFHADGTFNYTPNAGFVGSDSFTYKANDGTVDSNTATVTYTVSHVNHAPVANDSTLTTAEDTAGGGTVTATDADGDALNFAKATDPAHGAVTVNTDGSFSYTPAANFNGSDSFTFSVSDGNGGSATGTVSVTVTAVNDAPVAADGSLTVDQDTSNDAGTLNATDVDTGSLTFSKVTDPAHGAVTVNGDGSFSYTPAAGFVGSDSFTFKANDGSLDSNVATVSITVAHVNHAPSATAGTLAVNRNTAKTGLVAGADQDGDNLGFSVVSQGAHGTVAMQADGSFTYTPAKGFVGSDSFTFKANDGSLDSAPAAVSVTVIEHAPVALAQSLSMTHNTSHRGLLKFSDKDTGDKHTFSRTTLPKHGTVTVNTTTGGYTYTPTKGFVGKDSFVFRVSDNLKSDTATVSITVK